MKRLIKLITIFVIGVSALAGCIYNEFDGSSVS